MLFQPKSAELDPAIFEAVLGSSHLGGLCSHMIT